MKYLKGVVQRVANRASANCLSNLSKTTRSLKNVLKEFEEKMKEK